MESNGIMEIKKVKLSWKSVLWMLKQVFLAQDFPIFKRLWQVMAGVFPLIIGPPKVLQLLGLCAR